METDDACFDSSTTGRCWAFGPCDAVFGAVDVVVNFGVAVVAAILCFGRSGEVVLAMTVGAVFEVVSANWPVVDG